MCPHIHIFTRDIPTYGLMAAAGILAVVIVLPVLARRRGLPPYDFLFAVLCIGGGALVGGSILYGLTNAGYLADVVSRAPEYETAGAFLLDFIDGFRGLVFYGGFFGGLAGMLIWLKATGRPKAAYLDLFAVGLPLFHAFARVGCFFGGCCYGIESEFGFVYTEDPIEIANGVTRFPVQLLESACEATLFAILLRLFLKERLYGQLVWTWAGLYAVVRFLDEFLRGDFYRGFVGPLSTSQLISLVVLVAVTVHFARWARRGRGAPAQAATA